MQVLTPGGETLVAPHRHRRSQERGWHCVRDSHPHRAPCALVPRWWNVLAKLRWEWQSYPLWANKRRRPGAAVQRSRPTRLERTSSIRCHHRLKLLEAICAARRIPSWPGHTAR